MSEFTWTGNAKVMFDESLKAAPLPFRNVTKKGLTNGLTKVVGDGGEVHEEDVVRAIKETTPAPFIGIGLKAVAPFLSDPTLLDR